jgi:hypothetical protein
VWVLGRVILTVSVEAKRCGNKAQIFSLRRENKIFFRMFCFEAKYWTSKVKKAIKKTIAKQKRRKQSKKLGK